MHWTDYAIKATVYLTGPLMVLIGLLVFQRAWVVLAALATGAAPSRVMGATPVRTASGPELSIAAR